MSIIDKIKSLFKKHKTERQETTSNTEDEERLKRAILVAQELEQYETKHNLLAIMKREYKIDFIEALDTFGYAELLEWIEEEELDEDYITIEQRLISFIFKEEVPEDKRQEIKESTAKLFNITMALYEERMEAERQKMFAHMWNSFSASRNIRPGMPYAIRDYERNYRRD